MASDAHGSVVATSTRIHESLEFQRKEDGERTVTLTVNDDGTWSVDAACPDITSSTTGNWSLTGGNLTITEYNAEETLLLRDDENGGMALSIPAEVDEDDMLSSFQWTYANGGLQVPVSWDKDS
ncbi:hypothetical protein [Actinomyces ruminis]|uniref:Uncharacterized protein n=1 Tax=Actinomyces ruminis TaxID=1937003 RepID=A0ABX4M9J4_9ACTO|nr:hypothetical protein [Actinomyces ruminis]PHP52135.1 hypothetical protein BW737_011685 [Actinomyces ruminis]